jgi:hypothetical protein
MGMGKCWCQGLGCSCVSCRMVCYVGTITINLITVEKCTMHPQSLSCSYNQWKTKAATMERDQSVTATDTHIAAAAQLKLRTCTRVANKEWSYEEIVNGKGKTESSLALKGEGRGREACVLVANGRAQPSLQRCHQGLPRIGTPRQHGTYNAPQQSSSPAAASGTHTSSWYQDGQMEGKSGIGGGGGSCWWATCMTDIVTQ